MGHGAWGMGHGAWGMGYGVWVWGMQFHAPGPMPHAPGPMPHPPCPTPHYSRFTSFGNSESPFDTFHPVGSSDMRSGNRCAPSSPGPPNCRQRLADLSGR